MARNEKQEVSNNIHIQLGAFDFKRRCTEWSVYDIKVP